MTNRAHRYKQSLVPRLEVVPKPDTAHVRGADVRRLETEFVGHALRSVGRMHQGVIEDPRLSLVRDPVRVWTAGTALPLDEGMHATDPEGALHFTEGVAVVAFDLAGLGDPAEFFGRCSNDSFLRVLCAKAAIRSSSFSLGDWLFSDYQSTSEVRVTALSRHR